MERLLAVAAQDIEAMGNPADETSPFTVVLIWWVRKGREMYFEKAYDVLAKVAKIHSSWRTVVHQQILNR